MSMAMAPPYVFSTSPNAWQRDRRRSENPKETVATIQARHRLIVRKHLEGSTVAEIAAEVGYTDVRVLQVLNSPMVRTYIEALGNRADDRAVMLASERAKQTEKALSVMNQAMDGYMEVEVLNEETGKVEKVKQLVSPVTRFRAAQDTLNRDPRTAPCQRTIQDAGRTEQLASAVAEAYSRFLAAADALGCLDVDVEAQEPLPEGMLPEGIPDQSDVDTPVGEQLELEIP